MKKVTYFQDIVIERRKTNKMKNLKTQYKSLRRSGTLSCQTFRDTLYLVPKERSNLKLKRKLLPPT